MAEISNYCLKNYHRGNNGSEFMEVIEIDGSIGEGGGQILRTSVTLASIIQQPIRIVNIRKNRKITGLRPQHLVAIKLLAKICNANVNGLKVGSKTIEFFPSKVKNKILHEDIGTAGSIPLVLQTLVSVISISKKNFSLSIKGGTDVQWSPSSNYMKFVLKEAYSRMGLDFEMNIKKRGYYPKGNGEIELEISPLEKLKPICFTNRTTKRAKIVCSYSKFKESEIKREVNSIKNYLINGGFFVETKMTEEQALDKGASILIYSSDESSITGFDGLINLQSGKFESDLGRKFKENNLGVDGHLADMLVIPASFCPESSVFYVKNLTHHLKTNLEITSKILKSFFNIKKIPNGFEIEIRGSNS